MDTRTQILQIAFKLFFKKGFKAVTMSELVQASGLSKGAFYHYFSSKEALYNEAIEKSLASYFENFQLDYDPELTLRNNLKKLGKANAAMMEEFSQIIDDEHVGLNVYLLYLQTAITSPEFKGQLQHYFNTFHKTFDDWFQQAQSSGEIKPGLNPHFLAKQIMATMEGLNILDAFSPTDETLEDNFMKIIDQFFDQIETNKTDDNTSD